MIVGIDLGTTHSLIGYFGPDGPTLVGNALDKVLTPSAVAVDAGGRVLVGQAALDRIAVAPESGAALFKRYMGSERETVIGKHRFRPEELSAIVLRALIADVEAATGSRVTEAVISVPAYFSDSQRKATRLAGELAGIRVERLINEPTAAALAYGLQERTDESTFLVFDLGGGTFDVSILECFEGVMQVHATAGDNQLGGHDFLRAMFDAFCLENAIRPSSLSARERILIQSRLELAKCQLSKSPEVNVEVRLGERDLAWALREDDFDVLVEPLVQRLRTPVERALRDARLDPARLDEVILVGGASRMPLVPRLVARMLGRLPLRHMNPDEVVALGAAVAAGMKVRDERLEEIVLTDVCPYTLGVATSSMDESGRLSSGLYLPIIDRNCTVPVSRVHRFQPVHDWQQRLTLEVYQGESPRVINNVKLGELSFPLQRKRAEDNPVDVRFTYDINGVLQVEVDVIATGTRHELLLEKNPGSMSNEEIRQRLQKLAAIKVHPRDEQPNIAALARAERLYEESLGQQRTMIQAWIIQFTSVLDSQDADLVDKHRRELDAALDQLEYHLP